MASKPLKPTLTFAQLPKEIRLLIWEATFSPQYILLRFVEGRRPFTTIPSYAFKPYDDPIHPVALKVNHESRTLALQRYKPWHFRWYLLDREIRSKLVMWDPRHDIVVLPKTFILYQLDVMKALFRSQLRELRNLAVPGCFWLIDHSTRAPFSILAVLAKTVPKLEKLIICLGGKSERRGWDAMIPFEPLLKLSPGGHVSRHIELGLECIKSDIPDWPLSSIKVWEAEDDPETSYREVFEARVGVDKDPVYTCWCCPTRWDTSIHDRHDLEDRVSAEKRPSPVVVWRRPRYGNRSHFRSRYSLSRDMEVSPND